MFAGQLMDWLKTAPSGWVPELITVRRVVSKAPSSGAFCLGTAMQEVTDFFQKEAQECKKLAAQATGKSDRRYWLELAERWESLQQPDEAEKAFRFDRPIIRRKKPTKQRAA